MIASRLRPILLGGAALVAFAGTAHAQDLNARGTAAGTTITNTAQASYTVNGTAQTVSSNAVTFKIDRKVDFTIERVEDATIQVNLEQKNVAAAFRVTNLTNGIQDFNLDPDQQNLSLGVLPGTDDFDVDQLRVFVDGNGNGTYEADEDTETYIDQLAPNGQAIVFVVGDVPNEPNANLAFVSLHAIVADGTTAGSEGTRLLPTDLNIINQDDEVDVVFADNDSDGVALGDIARNGEGRAYAAFEIGVRAVNLSVVKSSRVVSDGVNVLNPKALPGAVVEYCLTVANATLLTPATNVTLTDVIPDNTTYVPGSIRVGGIGAAGACLVDGIAEDDDANDTGELDPYRGSFDADNNRVTAVIPTLLGGTSLAASFQVTVK
ncbi:DUF11 domain-containing protein [Sphingomonas sp. ac-8]|uniref:DUF11 domain-containing protein n=1 Tax=Sphingomonas sp. ac-8 TaxID=3242977 RepID=UPI003A802345